MDNFIHPVEEQDNTHNDHQISASLDNPVTVFFDPAELCQEEGQQEERDGKSEYVCKHIIHHRAGMDSTERDHHSENRAHARRPAGGKGKADQDRAKIAAWPVLKFNPAFLHQKLKIQNSCNDQTEENDKDGTNLSDQVLILGKHPSEGSEGKS